MARPQKRGLDYFPLDTVLDIKFDLIEAEFGLTGFAVIVKLLQKIYAEQGYYCEYTNEVALLFAKKLGLGGSVVSEIITSSIKRGIFNSELFYKYQILTSVGIQKRYFEAVSRRIIQVENEYLLVNAGQLSKSVSINSINVDINSKIVDNNSTKEKKEKEIKVKESKVKETKEKNADSVCVDVVVEYFKANVGTISSAIIGDISFYLQQGFEQNLIIECIKKAVFAGKPSWNYVKGILKNLANSGVKTLVDFDKQSNKKKVNNTVGSGQTSYNLEELDEFWNTVPKLD